MEFWKGERILDKAKRRGKRNIEMWLLRPGLRATARRRLFPFWNWYRADARVTTKRQLQNGSWDRYQTRSSADREICGFGAGTSVPRGRRMFVLEPSCQK